MSTYSLIKDALNDLVIGALYEYPSISPAFSHQKSTVDSLLYINILETEQVGKTQKTTLLDTDSNLYYTTSFDMLVSFSCQGNQAGDIIYSLYERLGNTDRSLEANKLANLSLLTKNNIRRVPYKTDTKWIEYFNFTARLRFTSGIAENIVHVQEVTVESNIGLDETTLATLVFTIPPS